MQNKSFDKSYAKSEIEFNKHWWHEIFALQIQFEAMTKCEDWKLSFCVSQRHLCLGEGECYAQSGINGPVLSQNQELNFLWICSFISEIKPADRPCKVGKSC